MNIKIQTVRFDADKNLLDLVEKKVGKLEKFYDRLIGAEVFLRLDNESSKIKDKVVEIRLIIPGNDLFSKESSKSFEESVDMAVDSVLKQLKKHKEKTREERVRKSEK